MKVDERLFYPPKIEKELKWIIKNYNRIDELIEEEREAITDLTNNSVDAKLKSEAGYLNANAIEDIIIKIDESPRINRLKKWKEVLDISFQLLKTEGYPYTVVIDEKYLKGNSTEMILELLNTNQLTLYYIELDIRRSIFNIALDYGLYKE